MRFPAISSSTRTFNAEKRVVDACVGSEVMGRLLERPKKHVFLGPEKIATLIEMVGYQLDDSKSIYT